MTAAVPVVVGVNVEAHVADAIVPARVHVVNVPVTPVSESATVPVGVMKAPAELSVTVTLQVDAVFTFTGEVQVTVAVVLLGLTVILVVPLLEV